EDREAALVFTATDGYRLANLRSVIGSVEREGGRFEGVIIPRAAAAEIGRFAAWADGPMVVQIGERIIEVSAKGRYFASKLLDGTFPDYERVIPKGEDRKVVLKSKELGDAVGLVMNVSQERSRCVRFDLHDDHLEVSARGDQHSARAVVDYEEGSAPGDDIAGGKGEHTFGLNAAYVLAALAVSGELVTLSMTDPMSPVLFHAGDELRQVIMPLRV
ncbi:MAG: DNA polymerase III subunit beta, partial [Hyphomonas sp.]|nr:DNA polymerase III subunit beta [Hyphomonas sp.]